MRQVRLAALLVAIAANSAAAQSSRVPAGFESRSWTIAGVKRTALVRAPRMVPPAGAPLVLVFHGHGGTAANMTRAMPIHAEWSEAIVIYPQGRNAEWQKEPGALGDRDLLFVDSLLAWAKSEYRVDAKRVFAAGHSNGGWFTYVLWAARPDQFAAFAPAAAVFGKLAIGAKPKPALIIAGEKDRLVPYTLQRRTINTVVQLDGAETLGEVWFGGAKLHKSEIAEVATYVHPGAHPLPANAAAVVARFFKTR